MERAKINRINELAAKKRTSGLTPEETAEQETLRAEYLAGFRKNLESQLENVYVIDENGCKTKLLKRP
ncbi:MAG: DUF896 domain-containing protein [Oscillospiraceae bacterium]